MLPYTFLAKSTVFTPCGQLEILHYVIINDVINSKRVSDYPSIRMKEVRICENLLYGYVICVSVQHHCVPDIDELIQICT